MLMTSISFTITISAGSEEDPEIEDVTDTEVAEYLDVLSAWFYEKEDQPEYLFTAIKMKKISLFHLKQHLFISWDHNEVPCASGMIIGYGKPWAVQTAGYGHGWWFEEHYQRVEGDYDPYTGIITCKIPKEIINNPQKGDVLTNTYASAFQRFGFLGRLGFDRGFLKTMIYHLSGIDLVDFAPEPDGYGRDYIIQY